MISQCSLSFRFFTLGITDFSSERVVQQSSSFAAAPMHQVRFQVYCVTSYLVPGLVRRFVSSYPVNLVESVLAGLFYNFWKLGLQLETVVLQVIKALVFGRPRFRLGRVEHSQQFRNHGQAGCSELSCSEDAWKTICFTPSTHRIQLQQLLHRLDLQKPKCKHEVENKSGG